MAVVLSDLTLLERVLLPESTSPSFLWNSFSLCLLYFASSSSTLVSFALSRFSSSRHSHIFIMKSLFFILSSLRVSISSWNVKSLYCVGSAKRGGCEVYCVWLVTVSAPSSSSSSSSNSALSFDWLCKRILVCRFYFCYQVSCFIFIFPTNLSEFLDFYSNGSTCILWFHLYPELLAYGL